MVLVFPKHPSLRTCAPTIALDNTLYVIDVGNSVTMDDVCNGCVNIPFAATSCVSLEIFPPVGINGPLLNRGVWSSIGCLSSA